MGIGGGWYEHEWRAYGYGFPPDPERLARLREGVEIMHQAWTTGTATLDGEYYQVDGAIVQPQPLQAGGIPIWIAGGGEKVTLKIAAKYASYTNFAARRGVLAQERGAAADTARHSAPTSRRSRGRPSFRTVIGTDAADVAPSSTHRGARRVLPRSRGDRSVHGRVPHDSPQHAGRDARADRRGSPSGASSASATRHLLHQRRRTTGRASSCSGVGGHPGAA
jgi:alkanesulfonate monooxygenase SsuD/methylene tetrahydromethanopterin reductase-like flavin-dependent oxidoreductase (luciferase family)